MANSTMNPYGCLIVLIILGRCLDSKFRYVVPNMNDIVLWSTKAQKAPHHLLIALKAGTLSATFSKVVQHTLRKVFQEILCTSLSAVEEQNVFGTVPYCTKWGKCSGVYLAKPDLSRERMSSTRSCA